MIRRSTLWQTHHGLKAVSHTVFELWPKTSSGISSDDPKSKISNFGSYISLFTIIIVFKCVDICPVRNSKRNQSYRGGQFGSSATTATNQNFNVGMFSSRISTCAFLYYLAGQISTHLNTNNCKQRNIWPKIRNFWFWVIATDAKDFFVYNPKTVRYRALWPSRVCHNVMFLIILMGL